MKTSSDIEKGGAAVVEDPRNSAVARPFDVDRVRREFPILSTTMHGRPLVYLDNGATTQKPRAVIERITGYYERENANIHRGVYSLSQNATAAYEDSRRVVQRFINAPLEQEIIFTRGTTEGINLVAATWGRANLRSGDEVLVSAMEHHSNIVPWQIVAEAAGARVRPIPMNDDGELLWGELESILRGGRVKMVAVTHLSNALGTINDVKRISQLAHAAGARVLVDGAQWVAHFPTDVQDIGCDFYAFSGHKLFGPTGIGVLWGRAELLDAMPPYQGGGDMIRSVTFEKTEYADLPNKFEAGTPDIAGVVGLAAAIEFVNSIGFDASVPYEHDLFEYATQRLRQVKGLRIIGNARHKASVLSFVMEDPAIASMDLGLKLDREGIAIRTGHHCCQPVMDRFGIPGTARASLAMYNTRADVDALVDALNRIVDQVLQARPTVQPAQAVTTVKFPEPSAGSPDAAAAELESEFEMLGDWEARDQYVIEMGEKLLPMLPEMKTEGTRVHGCMSTVHLVGRKKPGTADVYEFLADSDAHLVRGLIAVLQRLYSGQRAKDVVSFDVESFLRRIGLDQHLSMGRRNGLAGMIKRIRQDAARIA